MSTLIRQAVQGPSPVATQVPEKDMHLPRFPFLFLVDISASTGEGGNDADIHVINQTLSDILSMLRTPPPGNELAAKNKQIDVMVMTYSDTPEVYIDWTVATKLPTSVHFEPVRSTATYHALTAALEQIGRQLQTYRDNKMPTAGMPHIFHLTDGAPTDVQIGSAEWTDISDRLSAIRGATNPEKQDAVIIHFIAPNGCRILNEDMAPIDEQGTRLTGQQTLTRMTGPDTVFELSEGAQSMHEMVAMVTHLVTRISRFSGSAKKGAKLAVEAAREHISSTQTTIKPSDVA
jgi:uncharacterized protein YegL